MSWRMIAAASSIRCWSTGGTKGRFKGVGEGGVIGAVPALVNAVQDALLARGVRVTRLPLSPDVVIGWLDGSR